MLELLEAKSDLCLEFEDKNMMVGYRDFFLNTFMFGLTLNIETEFKMYLLEIGGSRT